LGDAQQLSSGHTQLLRFGLTPFGIALRTQASGRCCRRCLQRTLSPLSEGSMSRASISANAMLRRRSGPLNSWQIFGQF
jgi:hypothetical protein